MLGTHDLGLFILTGLLLNVMPGPDSLLIMARSAAHGFRAGSAAALGIGAGTCVHVLAAALGLSALLSASAAAFTVVKLLGAAYLVYLGLSMLLKRRNRPAATGSESSPAAAVSPPVAPATPRAIFMQGFLTNVLNPKVALFFLAFVPQFISADAPSKALAFIFLGAIFNFNGMLWCHLLAWMGAVTGAQVRNRRWSEPLARWLNRGLGALFLTFGVRLALSDAR
ncbi:LysE family translocator [Roseateles terrae]|uniref:Threonine/homoserine/homoserine lactone efflux protein n=1 Tax=Roseateles terrae TaxID=431060 RepID=A0ABR6GXW1_9BURK|nr:LysE family translocator [Roseateles terrae]MBB3196943.1 threonine/homoserine/homoserine lactone efflux protein [Roseateles terrae]OWQ84516.1 lysine transporter LysE [Roseateles terrae]